MLKNTTDQNGIKTEYDYDDLLRPTKIVSNNGEITTTIERGFSFFGLGNYVQEFTKYEDETEPHTTLTTLDGLGRELQVAKIKNGLLEDQVSYKRYNKAGLVNTSWDWVTKKETTINYESVFLNRIQSIKAPAGTTSYAYANNSKAETVGSRTYGAKSLNKTTVTDIDNNQTETLTDFLSNTIISKAGAGSDDEEITKYLYDTKNRIHKVLPPGITSTTSNNIYEYTYNDNNRGLLKSKKLPTSSQSISYTYDDLDRLKTTKDLNGNRTIYEYNEIDLIKKTGMGLKDGTETTFDDLKTLSSFTYKSGKTWPDSESYRILDDLTVKNMQTTYYDVYDDVGRATKFTKSGVFGNGKDTYTLKYNHAGQIKTKDVYLATPNGTAPLQEWSYNYDIHNRLKDVMYKGTTLSSSIYERNHLLTAKYLQPNLETNTCLQKVDYGYNDDAKRLTDINNIGKFEKRNISKEEPLQCKISFKINATNHIGHFKINELNFYNNNHKVSSLLEEDKMNFPYYITENNDSGFINDLKAIMLSKGYIFNDVYLQFNEQLTLNFEQTNFIPSNMITDGVNVQAEIGNCCKEGLNGNLSLDTNTTDGSGKLGNCAIPVITAIDLSTKNPVIEFEHSGGTNKFTVEYKPIHRSWWTPKVITGKEFELSNLGNCYSYMMRIKATCGNETAISNINYFETLGCTTDCELDNFDINFKLTEEDKVTVQWSIIPGANFKFRYYGNNGWNEINTTSYGAFLEMMTPNINYNYEITINCHGVVRKKDGFFSTKFDPLLALTPKTDLFAQKLYYEGSNIDANGWQTLDRKSNNNNLDQEPFLTSYTFDALNRMTKADVQFPDHNGFFNVEVDYYSRGNIKTLKRKRRSQNNFDDYIDNLTYTYNSSIDRLMNIADTGDKNKGHIKDSGGNTYVYYNDGSVKIDRSKRLYYQYNHFNMPKKIIKIDNAGQLKVSKNNQINKYTVTQFENLADNAYDFIKSDFINLVYLANGEKLSMHTFKNNVEVSAVYYRDNVEIRNGDVIVNHSDGRIVYYNGSGNAEYQYYLKDHLGNVRIAFAECGEVVAGGCKNNDLVVIDENHYYPFGLKMEGYWNDFNSSTAITTNQYNGKEWVDDLGLAMNDYGARWYDPAVARWNSVDPLAEKYVNESPYSYVSNSPIKHIDPDGLEKIVVIGGGDLGQNDKYKFINTGLRKAFDYGNNELTTILLVTAYLTAEEIKKVENYGLNIVRVNNSADIINYFNSKSISTSNLSKERLSDKITDLTIYGHGIEGSAEFGYDYNEGERSAFESKWSIGIEQIAKLNRNAFDNTKVNLGTCNSATRDKCDNIFAREFSNQTNSTVSGYLGQSTYIGIYSINDKLVKRVTGLRILPSTYLPVSGNNASKITYINGQKQ